MSKNLIFVALKLVETFLLGGPKYDKKFNLKDHLSNFRVENIPVNWPFNARNNTTIIHYLHGNTFKNAGK